ncbi:usg protein [Acidiphilium sp. C61]|uniref:usg protein n=1 Tax=unclassified Acidiphilium TaxID=2617493 RepID=UPI000BDC0D8B|nr:MAG: Usg family protein [Acidiphilium sp. 20-67-58]OYV87664.1 MAG: Usg family protein [Acidiphilium sp. 21-68-69]
MASSWSGGADCHGPPMTARRRQTMMMSRQLEGYRLTTAEILYHLPDHPGVLQSYVWQDLDIAPRYPVLHQFLDFWSRQIEGRLHSVRVGTAALITPGEMRSPHMFQLH